MALLVASAALFCISAYLLIFSLELENAILACLCASLIACVSLVSRLLLKRKGGCPAEIDRSILWTSAVPAIAYPLAFGLLMPVYLDRSYRLYMEGMKRTPIVIETLVKSIQAFQARNRRLPSSVAEMESWLGRAMPRSAWGTEVQYTALHKDEAVVAYRLHTDAWSYMGPIHFEYNSLHAEAGVQVSPCAKTQPSCTNTQPRESGRKMSDRDGQRVAGGSEEQP